MRIDKFIADTKNISRSDAKALLKNKKITVNQVLCTDSSFAIKDSDIVCLNNEQLILEKEIYIVLNKPKGYISATEDKFTPTIVDLVTKTHNYKNLVPVGRLDKDTTGLIILTNNGDMVHKLTSPKKDIEKEYEVTLEHAYDPKYTLKIEQGLTLLDGTVCKPAKAINMSNNKCNLIITEGKYHQVKLMFEALGNKVIELNRVRFNNLSLSDLGLKVGESIKVSKDKII